MYPMEATLIGHPCSNPKTYLMEATCDALVTCSMPLPPNICAPNIPAHVSGIHHRSCIRETHYTLSTWFTSCLLAWMASLPWCIMHPAECSAWQDMDLVARGEEGPEPPAGEVSRSQPENTGGEGTEGHVLTHCSLLRCAFRCALCCILRCVLPCVLPCVLLWPSCALTLPPWAALDR